LGTSFRGLETRETACSEPVESLPISDRARLEYRIVLEQRGLAASARLDCGMLDAIGGQHVFAALQ